MKLFFKILFFIVTMIIITAEDVKSSAVATISQKKTSSSFIQKSQLDTILFENYNVNSCFNGKNVITYSEQVRGIEGSIAKGGNKTLYSVDKSFQARDEAAKVFKNGKYELNPTATTIDKLKINPSGTVKGKKWLQKEQTTEELLNGTEYMYVIDESDRLIIGTRAQHIPDFSTPPGKAPHPTLIGGADPKVQAAGTVEFRGGKIYKVDNASGHYKPSVVSLQKAMEIFKRDFPANSFTNDFKGFLEYGN